MPIPPLQIKWHLAILTWTINKYIQQPNQNNHSEYQMSTITETQKLDSPLHMQSSAKTSKQDFNPEEPTKHLFCIPWASESPQHLIALQSCSKGQIPQTQLTTKREGGKALSKVLAVAGCGLHQCPTQLSPQLLPKRKVASPNQWCLFDAERTPSCPQIWQLE